MTKHTIAELDVARWVDDIDRVFRSAYAVEAKLLGVESFPPLNRDREDLLSCGNRFVGSISAHQLSGVLELEAPDFASTVSTIASLAVAPSHFRQGIGKALVRSVLEEGRRRFRVTTGALNQAAIELYAALGFDLVGRFSTHDGVDMVELVFCPN